MTDAVHRLARELVDICAYHHKNNNLSVADLELAIATTSHALAVASASIPTEGVMHSYTDTEVQTVSH